MDWGAGFAALGARAGFSCGALAALASVAAWRGAAARARLAAENESLRDKLWRLRDAVEGRRRAEAASEAKSRFLAVTSHEIRAPLSGILGMAELLRSGALDPESASYVEAIRASGEDLIALVDELLDLSRIEAGRFALVIETVDLERLIEGVVELLAPQAQEKRIEIAASIAAAAPRRVRADGLRLRQILTNLLANAVKFTDHGGACLAVELSSDGRLQFSVVDTGRGVPLWRRAAIFERYEQGDGSDPRRLEGAGLGLAIARRLAGLMGGDLTLADNPGGGSVFTFAAALPNADASTPAPRRAPAMEGKRALIVAPSLFEAPALAARLAEVGAGVERAGDLASGLAALARMPKPDLVIIDCALGPDASHRLAAAARAAGARRSLVLFSPIERRAFGQTSLDRFDGWLVKPVRARSLFERLTAEQASPPVAFSAAPQRPLPQPARRALLAEDNDVNALVAETALRRLGFETARARDGEEALRLALETHAGARVFDLVLMDLRLPRLEGRAVAARLRRREAVAGRPPIPVVALTASPSDDDPSLAVFDAFLVKPLDFRALAETIARVAPRVGNPSVRRRAS